MINIVLRFDDSLTSFPKRVSIVKNLSFRQNTKHLRISQDNREYGYSTVINKLPQHKRLSGFHNSDWTFTTGTNQSHV